MLAKSRGHTDYRNPEDLAAALAETHEIAKRWSELILNDLFDLEEEFSMTREDAVEPRPQCGIAEYSFRRAITWAARVRSRIVGERLGGSIPTNPNY
jgi:hypothetical protein